MDRNIALMEIVSRKGFLGEGLYRGVCKEFPQFNASSKVNRVEQYEITLAVMEQLEFLASKKLYPKTGIKSRLWRALGELLNRKGVYNRGMELDTIRDMPPMKTRTLQLKRFGVTQGIKSVSIAIAYDALTDTLYVKD
jgi:hypothetical protein